MYEIILVPLDSSQRAESILPHVQSLASHYEAEIVFLQVFELAHLVDLPRVDDDDYQALPHIGKDEMQQHVEKAQSYLAGMVERMAKLDIPARSRIAYGPIASTIINTAIDEQADLIAMASHGSSGIQGVYYGSVAAGVLQRVDRPLLIVRAQD
ncbi:MAG: universal stress protein [Chloroflexi bacterium]|jgi:nucleotide-binding universal stress UspA family protein|nr:universal stress protein [Chloroflexota bacterium]